MSSQKYKNIGKKDIIRVMESMMYKLDMIETTLNILVMFVDKDKKFNDFMKDKLGAKDEFQSNETTNGESHNTKNNGDT